MRKIHLYLSNYIFVHATNLRIHKRNFFPEVFLGPMLNVIFFIFSSRAKVNCKSDCFRRDQVCTNYEEWVACQSLICIICVCMQFMDPDCMKHAERRLSICSVEVTEGHCIQDTHPVSSPMGWGVRSFCDLILSDHSMFASALAVTYVLVHICAV